jgi:hypothetical protein
VSTWHCGQHTSPVSPHLLLACRVLFGFLVVGGCFLVGVPVGWALFVLPPCGWLVLLSLVRCFARLVWLVVVGVWMQTPLNIWK